MFKRKKSSTIKKSATKPAKPIPKISPAKKTPKAVQSILEPIEPTLRFRIDHLNTSGMDLDDLEIGFVQRGNQVDEIIENVRSRRAPTIMGAPAGWGKSTQYIKVKHELKKMFGKRLKIAEIPTLNMNADEFMQAVAEKWRVYLYDGGSMSELLDEIKKRLRSSNLNLLHIDEAMDIHRRSEKEKARLAAAIRALIDLRGKDGKKLCSVIITGLSETNDGTQLLNEFRDSSETLYERLKAGVVVLPAMYGKVEEYVEKYSSLAGLDPEIFSDEVLDLISDESGGSPRGINEKLYKIIKNLPDELPKEIDCKFCERALGKTEDHKIGQAELEELTDTPRKTLEYINKTYPDGVEIPVLAEDLKEAGIVRVLKPDASPRPATSNICRGLVERKLLVREEKGKTYIVKPSPHARQLLART